MSSSVHDPNKLNDLAENETCTAHGSALVCTCVTCGGVTLCHLCSAEHIKHQLTPYGDLKQSLVTLINKAKIDQKNLEDAQETICRMLERVEACVQVRFFSMFSKLLFILLCMKNRTKLHPLSLGALTFYKTDSFIRRDL